MNKEEILAKSRLENIENDPLKAEAELKGNKNSVIIAFILATIMVLATAFTGHGFNYGFYGIAVSVRIGPNWQKWKLLHEKQYLLAAIWYSVITAVFIIAQIYFLYATKSKGLYG